MKVSQETLRDYLTDALPDAEMALVEKALRDSPELRQQLDELRTAADRGDHTIGGIWRRERLSCPSREQLGGYLLSALEPDLEEYIKFHLEIVGCAVCQANLDDLTRRQAETATSTTSRRQRILKSSAGLIRKPGRS
ncbi:MAG: hypothetical protein ACRCZF_04025 [Gemmataceae bacterium]